MSEHGQEAERRTTTSPDGAGPGLGPGTNILLFEDDETLAGLLARVLRTDGYHVDVLDSADVHPGRARSSRATTSSSPTSTWPTTPAATTS